MKKKFVGTGAAVFINSATTTQVATGPCVLERIIIEGGTVSVYDSPDTNENQIISLMSGSNECGIYMQNGLRIVTAGVVNVTVVYNKRG